MLYIGHFTDSGAQSSNVKSYFSATECTVPKYRAAVDYTPRLRASQNLLRYMANSGTCETVANNYPGSATANSYPGTTST